MKRVVLIWIAAFILIHQGIAQITEKSPYIWSVLDSELFKQKLIEGDHFDRFKRELHEESVVHPEAVAPSNGEIVVIADIAFLYALIDKGIDTDEDSLISYVEAGSVSKLLIIDLGITDMTGIEAFVMLDTLVCDANSIDSLNLSTLSELVFLSCSENHIDTLDLSNNLLLERLDCKYNQLGILDVSANLNLEALWCEYNNLESLDVSDNESLEELNCAFNKLTGLILPDDCVLWVLRCSGNSLENLDVTGCPLLEIFRCFSNEIISLDLSNNPLLKELRCENNKLWSLDVSNNLDLNAIWCGENLLTTLDLSNNTKIGSTPYDYVHLNVEYMPSLGEVCVWDSFPGDATIGYDGSPNLCFENGEWCDGVCTVILPGIEGFNHSNFLIYPNPTSDILTIETATFGPHSIQLHSLKGKELFYSTFTGTLHQIDLSFCRKGIYILHIRSNNHTATSKVVKL